MSVGLSRETIPVQYNCHHYNIIEAENELASVLKARSEGRQIFGVASYQSIDIISSTECLILAYPEEPTPPPANAVRVKFGPTAPAVS